ncbi:hypothetical protein DIE16_24005 [Burkholderia sp. Bp9090]|nr:hypothetical protein DIE10_10975 [Burkholderia sp. Bp9011]RQR94869.1 hypothetical protein DIE09_11160 [Burkholderia sp. Bp9010]RQS15057.1 hypothetical protein DIE02_00235 [Burkholderia sp. Bp8991]RQS32994.1 hypothetical protein DIE05_05500 [Burkholderia sp. Bp8995]RQS50058.1 hypothetical protein DIE00_07210 [Burkholderia sp. Bp8989]RQS57781.1 hypothetical protein DID99_08020 [Burkholderia sp. Bp8986]RQS63733.1 hypothetical protein DID98_02275 [Burkholderia sp. Bp8984]RQS68266.1 hypothetic
MGGRPVRSCADGADSSIRHCRRAGRCASDDCPAPAAVRRFPASGDKKGQPGLPFRAVPVHCNHRNGAKLTSPCRWRERRTCS